MNIARLVAPPVCIGCNAEGSPLCRPCYAQLASPPHRACFGCNQYNSIGATCLLCRRLTAVSALTAAATYDGPVQRLILRLKYRRQREVAAVLARLLTPLLDPTNFDVITSVPVASTRLRRRGYNQAELIARDVARQLNLPYQALIRRADNRRQVGTSRSQRLRQASDAFAPTRKTPVGRRILLIDDVLTTGATLDACAKVLATAHNARVWAAVIAKAEH